MNVVVVLELCEREELVPIILPLVDKDPEVLFQLLVDSLRLPVPLWMIRRSGCQFDSKEAV